MHDPETNDCRVLLIGYGNPGRLDDGLGPALVDRLRGWAIDTLTVESTYQLAVEDAERVAEFDVVLFADASLDGAAPFALRRLAPRSDCVEFTTHALAPHSVLGLARDLYGSQTVGYWLAIRGYAFDDFGEQLSPEGTANLDAAEATVRAALSEPDPRAAFIRAAEAHEAGVTYSPPGTSCQAFKVETAPLSELPT